MGESAGEAPLSRCRGSCLRPARSRRARNRPGGYARLEARGGQARGLGPAVRLQPQRMARTRIARRSWRGEARPCALASPSPLISIERKAVASKRLRASRGSASKCRRRLARRTVENRESSPGADRLRRVPVQSGRCASRMAAAPGFQWSTAQARASRSFELARSRPLSSIGGRL